MDVRLSTRAGRTSTIVEVAGDLDISTAPALRDHIRRLIDGGSRRFVLDLSGVDFIDSTALGVLVVLFKSLRDAGGGLALAAPRPSVRSVLALTSLDRAIDVFDTVESADAGCPPS